MSLCNYKNIFGAPNTGSHKYRIFNIAIVDVVATVLVGYMISKIFNYDLKKVLVILFLLGIIAHRLFCVRTTVDKILFN